MVNPIYKPIDSEREQIRLLELAPGAFDDDLVLSLRVRNLRPRKKRKWPVFEALSYFWGKQVCERPAILHGHEFTIQRNLDCALRHLRHESGEPRILWVDAVCINQADVDERSSQVRIMGRIFASAATVAVWLGPERIEDQIIFDFARTCVIPDSWTEARPLLRAFKRVCRRPWFGRVWIVQELALAKADPVLHFGLRTLCWSDFHDRLSELEQKAFEMRGGEWNSLDCFYFGDAADRVSNLEWIRIHKRFPLSLAIHSTRHSLATDPRDCIYGLLAICCFDQKDQIIVADYSKTVPEVFTEATTSLILEGDSPYFTNLLRSAGAPNPAISVFLPSWVFDFTISSRLTTDERLWETPRRLRPGNVKAWPSTDHLEYLKETSKISGDGKTLITVGLHLGLIDETIPDLFSVREPSFGRIDYAPSAKRLNHVYNHVLVARHIPAEKLIRAIDGAELRSEDQIASCTQIMTERLDDDEFHIEDSNVLDFFLQTREHRVFITKENHVGMTYHPDPDGVRKGDVLVGLFGLNLPFVLRPVPGTLDEHGIPSYQMINIAHVAHHKFEHDFLGEITPGSKWSDYEKFGIREYRIV